MKPSEFGGTWTRRAALAGAVPSAAALALGVGALRGGTAYASAPPRGGALGAVDVRDFGAVGNGTHDDGPAFQRSLDAAQSGPGTVLVPPGTYAINQQLTATAPIRIVGVGGWSATTLLLSDTLSTGLAITTPPNAYPGAGIEVSGLAFEYGGSGTMLSLSGGYPNTLVEGCRFYASGAGSATGLLTTGQHDDMITHCQFYGSSTSVGVGIALDDTDNAKIIDNMFYKLGQGISGIRGAQRVDDAGCLIVSNSMYGFTDALHFEGWELVQAIGNIVDGANNNCFYLLDCYHSLIADNYLGVNGTSQGVLMETSNPYGAGFTGQITFRGNYINHYAGASGEAAIAVYGANASIPEDQILIDGNIINGYPSRGVHLRNAQNVMIKGNTFTAAASGSTTVLDETPGHNYILDNIVDGAIDAPGDFQQNNFQRAPYPT